MHNIPKNLFSNHYVDRYSNKTFLLVVLLFFFLTFVLCILLIIQHQYQQRTSSGVQKCILPQMFTAKAFVYKPDIHYYTLVQMNKVYTGTE